MRHLIFHFVCHSLCACVHSKSACASICKYSMSFCSFSMLSTYIFVSFCVSASVSLAATLIWSLLLLSVLIFWHNHYFRQSLGEFKWHSLPLPVCCTGKLFKVSTNYSVLFVLQRVTFCFCLFFKLSLVTTIGVDAWFHLSFDII